MSVPSGVLIDLKGEHPRSACCDPCEPTMNGFPLLIRAGQGQVAWDGTAAKGAGDDAAAGW